jgi:hypothetical protein
VQAAAQSGRAAAAAATRVTAALARCLQFEPGMAKDWGAWVEEGRAEARRDALWLLGTVAVIAVLVLALVVVTA